MKTLIEVLITIFSAIADFYLILGGIKWITSGGDRDNVSGARNQILATLLMIAFLTCTSLLIFFLVPPVAVDALAVASLFMPILVPLLIGGLAVLSSISKEIRIYILKDRSTNTSMPSSQSIPVASESEAVEGALRDTNEPRQPPKQPSFYQRNDGSTCVYNIHSSWVVTVAWSPNGSHIASAGGDGVVRVWDADTGNTLLTYQGHFEQLPHFAPPPTVYVANWSPNGRYIASAGDGKVVNVWDAVTGRTICIYRGHSGFSGMIYALSWSPDGTRIASACSVMQGIDKTVHIWEAATGKILLRCDASYGLLSTFSVLAVAWSPDGSHIAAACGDRTIRVWHAVDGHCIYAYLSNSAAISNIAWSPDSTMIAVAKTNHTVEIWNTRTAKNSLTYHGHTGSVRDVAWSPDGSRIASASNDRTVQIWEALTGRHISTYLGHSDWTTSLAWSPDGLRIASGSNDKTVQVWQVDPSAADLSSANLSSSNDSDIIEGVFEEATIREGASVFRLRIIEDPLTPSTLASLLLAVTDLVTKCWLAGHGRFADLIEYTQTRDVRFVEETQLAFTRITYNSPFDASFKIDLSAPSVAEAIRTTIDAIAQRKHRIDKAELENKGKTQEIEHAKQRAEQESRSMVIEQERQMLTLERERLEILEKRLDVQKKGIAYALEIAAQTVTVLHPSSDEQTKAMLIQTLLPTILQFQNGKNVELVLSLLPINDQKAEQGE